MNSQQLSDQVSVSGQVAIEDIAALKDAGIEVLVCNRPDGEAADQTPYAEIATTARAAGIEVYDIPFTGGSLTETKVKQFADLLGTGKRVHAYCRTGNRCTLIFNAARDLLPPGDQQDKSSAAPSAEHKAATTAQKKSR